MEIREIAEHTQTDTILTKLKDLILDGKTYISKNLPELQTYRNIFSEITVLNNETLLKKDKIVLPASLVNKALSLSHSGAHPGRNGLIRRLRTHFYIKGFDKYVNFVDYLLKRQQNTQQNPKESLEDAGMKHMCRDDLCWDETSVMCRQIH